MKALDGNNGDFRRKLTLYLDGALSREESRDFLAEMQRSPECLKQLEHEKSFRDFLRNRVSRKQVSSSLIHSIKSKLNLSS